MTPPTYTLDSLTATDDASATLEASNWWVHSTFPSRSHLRRKASWTPVKVGWPGKVPSVQPAMYKPNALWARALTPVNPDEPNCRVQTTLPLELYFRMNAVPVPVPAGNVPNVNPPT